MKLAVIIGNNDYNYLDKLCLCIRDAELVNDTLTKLGFRTRLCKNCTNEEIRDELMRFGDQLEEGDIAFFYFGGHAGQQSIGNRQDNYLFGIDANSKEVGESNTITGIAVNQKIIERWFREECIYLIVLDACREYPASNVKYKAVNQDLQTFEPQRTLAPAYLPEYVGKGQYDIMYACQPGKYAIEDEKLKHGYLASALCDSLKQEETWNAALTETMGKVHKATKGRQNPSVLHNVRVQLKLEERKSPRISTHFAMGLSRNRFPAAQIARHRDRQTLRYEVGDKRFYIYRGDITKLQLDAIVNATDQMMSGGGGVDAAIHRAAGKKLLQTILKLPEYEKDKRVKTGDAVLTPGFNLLSTYVIHTSGPIFRLQSEKESVQKLGSCYVNCLNIATEKNIKSIAFPAISSGVFGAPLKISAETSITTCLEYFRTYKKSVVEEVWFALLEYDIFDIYAEIANQKLGSGTVVAEDMKSRVFRFQSR
eukprot:TRINITY_DN11552_c0_g1_i1.p1 TRINITY_DN11552_c0_g1~~TRINITY_DN11552_c0_g1_i1.p1  ORF type:complete len:481 (-),score=68.84 TRINITY_DN11552_c0_g1_i1:693-2135(-)